VVYERACRNEDKLFLETAKETISEIKERAKELEEA
jgi:hypothetical protein